MGNELEYKTFNGQIGKKGQGISAPSTCNVTVQSQSLLGATVTSAECSTWFNSDDIHLRVCRDETMQAGRRDLNWPFSTNDDTQNRTFSFSTAHLLNVAQTRCLTSQVWN